MHDRLAELVPIEPAAMVEDHRNTGLTLRQHPVAFLRAELSRRHIMSCADAVASRDRRWVQTAGLVLVRQRPGSAKGVMFMTIEDETGVANVAVWQKVFETHRRTVLGSKMVGETMFSTWADKDNATPKRALSGHAWHP